MANRDDYFSQITRQTMPDGKDEYDAWNNSAVGGYNTHGFGDDLEYSGFNWLGRVWNDLTGQTAQQREFAQQEYLQDKMNEYNHPVEEMKRQKEAGVNPNLAAAGIAQAGSQSAQAPQVSSNTSGVSEGVSALSGLGSTIGDLALVGSQKHLNEASAKEADANADATSELTPARKKEILANAVKLMMEAKMAKHQSSYWATKALYASAQERMDLMGKLYNIRKANEERKKIIAETNIAKKQLDIMKEQLSQEQHRTKIMEVERHKAERIDAILQKWGVDVSLPENAMALEAADAGHLDLIMDIFENVEYAKSLGAYFAQLDTAFDTAFNNALGSASASAEFAPYLAAIESEKAALIEMYKQILQNPKDIEGFFVKVINFMDNLIQQRGLGQRVEDAQRPNVSPHRSNKYRDR